VREFEARTMLTKAPPVAGVARINGVALNTPDETLTPEVLRQRACTELLRQAAQRGGLLDGDDKPSLDGVISEAAAAAIEALLEQNVSEPEPSEEACRRYYAARESSFRTGERVRVRHILFAVTPGVDVAALRKKAEAVYLDVRCHAGDDSDDFAKAAAAWSNCPSGAQGGDLGWLAAEDCAPEFGRELFGHVEVGVLSRLVHSRFGLHVVEVLEREPGLQQSFEAVRAAVTVSLRRQTYVTALRQYLQVLAGAAVLEGVDLEAADTPLVR
jgi:peptidyl-prolyl cis-trans isomerase C